MADDTFRARDPVRCAVQRYGASKHECRCPLCMETYDPFFDAPATADERCVADAVVARSGAFGRGGAALWTGAVFGVRMVRELAAQGIEAGTDETLQAAQPEARNRSQTTS